MIGSKESEKHRGGIIWKLVSTLMSYPAEKQTNKDNVFRFWIASCIEVSVIMNCILTVTATIALI